MKKVSNYSCRSALIATCCGLISLAAPSADGATISATITQISPTGGVVIGTASPLANFTYSDTSAPISGLAVAGLTDLNGGSALDFGTLRMSGANTNVSPTFILGVTPTITPTPTPNASEIYFQGTVNMTSETVDFGTCGTDSTCAHPSTASTFAINGYPTSPVTNDTFVFENTGGYSFGIDKTIALNVGAGKSTFLYGFIAPQANTAPEPIPAATTGLAICGLLGFALRRKLQAVRS